MDSRRCWNTVALRQHWRTQMFDPDSRWNLPGHRPEATMTTVMQEMSRPRYAA